MSFFGDLARGVIDTLGGRSRHDARPGTALTAEQVEANRLALDRARGAGPTAAQALYAQRAAAAQRAVAARAASARGASVPLAQREALRQQAELTGEAAAQAAALRAQEQQAYTTLATGALGEQQRIRLGAEQTNAQTAAANAANTQRGAAAGLAALGGGAAISDVREKTDIRPVRDYRRMAREAAEAALVADREPPSHSRDLGTSGSAPGVLPEVRRALRRDVAVMPAPARPAGWLSAIARREGWDQPVDPVEDYGAPQDAPGWQTRGIETLMRANADDGGGVDTLNAWDWRYRARARRAMGLPADDGRRVGPMAQELMRSPIARDAVVRDPATGRLALDRDRALQLALGAAAAAHRRLDEEER